MSNIKELIASHSRTFEESLNQVSNMLSEENLKARIKTGIIITQTENGLMLVPLTDSGAYSVIGMMEAAKYLLIDGEY